MIQILVVIVFIILLAVFFRNFERQSVFYPMREIEATPEDLELTYEDIYFDTEDGKKLNGWFIPAKDSKAVILYNHGNAGNICHRLGIIQMMNKMGVDVFIYDYRGFGKSQGRATEKGTYLDARAAYDYLVSRSDYAGKNIILYGESIGGAVAIDLALDKKIAALITEAAFTSAKDVAKDVYKFIPVWLFMSIKYDSISKIDKIAVPKLIIHSRDDEIISFSQGQRLFEKAKPPKEFLEMRGGHNYAIIQDQEKYENGIKNFINKYLK